MCGVKTFMAGWGISFPIIIYIYSCFVEVVKSAFNMFSNSYRILILTVEKFLFGDFGAFDPWQIGMWGSAFLGLNRLIFRAFRSAKVS